MSIIKESHSAAHPSLSINPSQAEFDRLITRNTVRGSHLQSFQNQKLVSDMYQRYELVLLWGRLTAQLI